MSLSDRDSENLQRIADALDPPYLSSGLEPRPPARAGPLFVACGLLALGCYVGYVMPGDLNNFFGTVVKLGLIGFGGLGAMICGVMAVFTAIFK